MAKRSHLISTSTEFGEVVDDITEVLLEETVTAMDGDVDEICEEEGEEEQEEENISFCSDPSDDSADEETPAAEMDTGEGQVESYMPASYVSRSVINEEGVRERRHFCKICDKSYARTDKLRIHLRNVHDITTALESSKPFQCSTCPKSFGRLEHLRKHLGSHRGVDVVDALASYEAKEGTKAGFVCPICMKVYTRSEKLESHMLTHDETPFHCDRCDEGFSSLRTLKRHQDDCVAISMVHRCTTCNQLFTSARLLSLHQDEHADMDFICPVCGKTFGTRLLLSQHQRSKHEKAFQCPICGKQLSRQDKLDSHMKQHNGYPCKDCGDVFGSRRDWTKHRANHHHDEEGEEGSGLSPKVKRQRFQCQECPMSYATEQKLAAHMEDGHSEDGYPCPQCKIIFESKAKLKAHAYTHKGKLCGICGAVIKNSFAAHMRRHEGIKPFKCQVEGCGRDFLRNCDLTAHTKTHTGEKPFACDFPNCKMRFSRPYKVSLHRRTHTGEKPYKCEFQGCTRDFAQPFDLTLHMRRHTGEKPHQCERCKERFILGSILKKHQQNCVAVTEPQLVYMKTEIFE